MWHEIVGLLTAATTGTPAWLILIFFVASVGELGLPATCPALEALLIFSGFKLAQQLYVAPPLPFLASLLAGKLLGAVLMYSLSYNLGDAVIDRFGKYLRLSRSRLDHMVGKIGSFAIPSIVLARFTPGLAVATSVACGVSRIPRKTCFPAILIHVLVWQAVYLSLGALGHRFSSFHGLDPATAAVAWVAAVLAAAIVGAYMVVRKNRRSQFDVSDT